MPSLRRAYTPRLSMASLKRIFQAKKLKHLQSSLPCNPSVVWRNPPRLPCWHFISVRTTPLLLLELTTHWMAVFSTCTDKSREIDDGKPYLQPAADTSWNGCLARGAGSNGNGSSRTPRAGCRQFSRSHS